MIENSNLPKGLRHSAGTVALKPDLSLSEQWHGVAVLARALLKRIESLRTSGTNEKHNLADEVERFEAELITSALIETGGRQRPAARLLGMNITTLNRKLKRYQIKPHQFSRGVISQELETDHLS